MKRLFPVMAIAAAVIFTAAPARAQMTLYTSNSLGFKVQVPQGFDPKVVQRSGSELVNWPDGRRLLVLKQTQTGTLNDQFQAFLKINLSTLKGGRITDQQSGDGFTDAVVGYGNDQTAVFTGRAIDGGALLFAFTGFKAGSAGVLASVRDSFRRSEFMKETLSQAEVDYCTLALETKDDKKSELLLKRCIELPRTPPEAFIRMAELQMKTGRDADALGTYELGRKQFPKDPVMLGPLGRLLLHSRDDKLRDPYRAASLLQLASAATHQQNAEIELLLLEALVSARQCDEAGPVGERIGMIAGLTEVQEKTAGLWRAKAKDPATCKVK